MRWGERNFADRARAGLPGVAILLALLATAGGCTPWRQYVANGHLVGPNYCRPNAAIAERWIDAEDKRLQSDEPDLSHWWTELHDPVLDRLILCGVRQNLTLEEAGYRILQARAELAIQMGTLFPQTQQAIGSYSRNAISTLAANQQQLPQRFFDNWDLGFNLSWELDFWGRFRRAIESAQADLNASVFDYDDVLVTLLGDIASTYVEIRTLQQQIEYVKDNIKVQNESLEIAEARFRGGLTSDLDVQQAISQLAQTESLIPQFEKQLRAANDRLCVLLGIPTEDLTLCLGDKPIPTVAPDIIVGIPCDLLTRRPDIRRAEQQAAAQCAQIGVAESALYPHIAITGTVTFDAERFTDLFKNRSLQGNIGPGFQWDILNYGRLVNNVRLQGARFQELVAHYRNVVLRANAEAEDGIAEFLQSQLQAKAMQRSVTASSKAVDLAITQYRAGLVDFNRVALLEQNLVQQQDLLAQAQGDIAQGLVHTYRALGGGWEIQYECGPNGGEMPVEESISPNAEEVKPGAMKPSEPTPSRPQPPGPTNAPRKLELPGPTEGIPSKPAVPPRAKPESELPAPAISPSGDGLPPPPKPMSRKPDGFRISQASATEPASKSGTTKRIVIIAGGGKPFVTTTDVPSEAHDTAPKEITVSKEAKPILTEKPVEQPKAPATRIKLRYSSDSPPINDHAGLLPEDRGDVRWVR